MDWPKRKVRLYASQLFIFVLLTAGQTACLLRQGQRYSDFTTPTPIARDHALVLGFIGGRQSWDKPNQGVRKLAVKLRSMNLPATIETVENSKRPLALQLLIRCFDRNGDGRLDEAEKEAVRLVLYGQSFGGAAVVKLARQLHGMSIPVLLTVQIDSVGRGDGRIPPNVNKAANLYQKNGLFVRGQSEIKAEDPSRTQILGNFEFDYRKKKITVSDVNWIKRAFMTAHTKMDHDPAVWARVEKLITEELRRPAGVSLRN